MTHSGRESSHALEQVTDQAGNESSIKDTELGPEVELLSSSSSVAAKSANAPDANVPNVEKSTSSESSDESGSDEETDKSGDERAGADNKKSLHLSDCASDEALSFVESCSTLSSYTDTDTTSSGYEEESAASGDDSKNHGKNLKKRKRSSSESVGHRRRQSNSDSDDDSETDDSESDSDDDIANNGRDQGGTRPTVDTRKSNDHSKAKLSSKVASIWDIDDCSRRRPVNPNRKLWSDYTYKPDTNARQPRSGSRFTNSFTDKSAANRPAVPSANQQTWGSITNRINNRYPQNLGLGLGRGLAPDPSRRYEKNPVMSSPGHSQSYWQNRHTGNPYGHYQQQQRYNPAPPRGSYASVVQKGGARNAGSRRDEYPPKNNAAQKKNAQGQNSGQQPQQHHQQQGRHTLHQNNGQQHFPMQQRSTVNSASQSYNRGTVTAAQILQQQRQQQAKRQQAQGPQHGLQQKQCTADQTKAAKEWQPPRGAFAMMIGNQPVYIVQPTATNRPPIAQEDPAVIRAEPPVPQPYIVLPGGAPLSLNQGMLGGPFGYGGFQGFPVGGNGRNGKQITEDALQKICPSARGTSRQSTSFPTFNALPNIPPYQRMMEAKF